MTSTRRRALLSFTLLGTAAIIMPRAQAQVTRTIADTLAGDMRFARFLDIITRAGAVEDLRQADARTLFAPTDDAINLMPASVVNDLTADTNSSTSRSAARPFVLNHLVQGNLYAADMVKGAQRLRTLNGTEIELVSEGNMIAIRSLTPPAPTFQSGSSPAGLHVNAQPVRISAQPLQASNGVIYPINGVIMP